MDTPLVSIVIPTFNRRHYLTRTIPSLFAQEYPKDRYEIIIVDNGSTDDTAGLVRDLQPQAPCPLRYVLKDCPAGPGPARNLGVAKASGTVIAFIDSDCEASPGWLREGTALLHDTVGLVQGRTLPDPKAPWEILSRSVTIEQHNHIYECCNIFYRREALEAVGGFLSIFSSESAGNRESYVLGGEDTDLAYRVMRSGWRPAFAAAALVFHEVTTMPPWRWMIETRFSRWPLMVKLFPEMRDHFFLRYFMNRSRFWFFLALLSIIAGRLGHPIFLLGTLPYVADCASHPTVFWRGVKRPFRFLACLPRDLAAFIILALWSVKERTLVL